GAYRFARCRGGTGALQAACDAFLIYFVVQYISVALPGLLGIFNLWTMSLVGFGAGALLLSATFSRGSTELAEVSARLARPPAPWTPDQIGFLACAVFVVSYIFSHVYDQRLHPPVATDALVYHLPTAVR